MREVSCSTKNRESLMGFKFTPDRHPPIDKSDTLTTQGSFNHAQVKKMEMRVIDICMFIIVGLNEHRTFLLSSTNGCYYYMYCIPLTPGLIKLKYLFFISSPALYCCFFAFDCCPFCVVVHFFILIFICTHSKGLFVFHS